MRLICGMVFLAASGCLFAAPSSQAPFLIQHDYDPNLDLFGGGYYLTPDDGLILDSMTAAQGMSKLERIEEAKKNLQRLLDPAGWSQLRAPAEMQKLLCLVLYWLSRAYDAGASCQELLEELCRHGEHVPTPAESTLAEVLLFNFHLAQHLGVTGFQGEIKLGQGQPPIIPENDGNPHNRLALVVPILPPERFPEVAHQLFNYEIFDGPLPRAPSTGLAPSQMEFAQKLVDRGLLPPNALSVAKP